MRSAIPYGGGIFAKMEFPAFEYREYPKIVDGPGGTRVTVQNAREELELAGKISASDRPKPASQAEETQSMLLEHIKKQGDELAELRAKLELLAGGAPTVASVDVPKPGTEAQLELLPETSVRAPTPATAQAAAKPAAPPAKK